MTLSESQDKSLSSSTHKKNLTIACNRGTEWVEDRRFGGCKVSSRSTWLNWWDPSSERDPVLKCKAENKWRRHQARSSGLHTSVHIHAHTRAHEFQKCTFDEHVSNSLFTLMLFTVWLLFFFYQLLLLRRPICFAFCFSIKSPEKIHYYPKLNSDNQPLSFWRAKQCGL